MLSTDADVLNDQFAIAQHITFAATESGLPIAQIHNSHAAASVAVQGGHVFAFQPHGQQPVLWVSRQAVFEPGKTIRGGIPVCWPWFGTHPTDPALPFHGFVRAAIWQVRGTSVGPGDATEIRLGLTETDDSLALWPHPFDLEIVVTVGAQLRVDLITRNPGEQPFVCGGALHTYYTVGDVQQITIQGLDGGDYLDKTDGFKRKPQHRPVTIAGETDRVYLDTSATCVIDDPALGRRISIAKEGSRTTVIWNPWAEKAKQIADFGDDEYFSMVCVETANADTDVATVAPDGEHRLSAMIGLE